MYHTCLWGCDHTDRLAAILGCKIIQEDLSYAVGVPIIPDSAIQCFYFIGASVPGLSRDQWALARCIYIYLLILYYNHKCNNEGCSRKLPVALAKQLAGKCDESRVILNILKLYRPRSSVLWGA